MSSKNDDDKTVFKAKDGDLSANKNPQGAPEDKTVFKPKVHDSQVVDDDKTRIASKHDSAGAANPDEKLLSSESFAALSAEEQKRVAKLAAQRKRERELAHAADRTRLQSQAPQKSQAPQNPDQNLDVEPEDKTVIAPNLNNIEAARTIITSTPLTLRTEEEKRAKPPVLLKQRFELEAVLGAGGMGVVYKAKDKLKIEAQDRDPYVAIKVLGEEFKSHPEAFIALQRESRKTQRIAHPNIVNVHDFDRDGDTVFMTMEFLEGEPLDQLIKKYKTTGLPEDMAWQILEGISSALVHAHNENIIHSDFKPGNIFVTQKSVAKVFDFGIARAVAKAENLEESIDDKTVFDAGNLGALTPAYASKEMLDGDTPDVRDDIYALGCIAYELFSGKHPYDRMHANEAARQKLKPKRLAMLTKKQSRVVEKAVAFNREDRIATVQEFWDLLNAKRAPVLVVSMTVLVFAIVVAFAGFQYYQGQNLPQFSEDEARSEIEMQLRLEGHKEELENLLSNIVYNPRWERLVWEHFQGVENFTSSADPYTLGKRDEIFKAYQKGFTESLNDKDFDTAKNLVANISRYTDSSEIISQLGKQLDDAIKIDFAEKEALAKQQLAEEQAARQAQIKRSNQQQQSKVIKERNVAFDVAMDTVNKQLTCRSLAMRDFSIAIEKLRSLNPSRYAQSEKKIVSTLAACISKIGVTFPERAEKSKILALRTFPKSDEIKNIKIIARDPCDLRLAGFGARGARGICRDKIEGVGRGPAMVVIPGKGSIKPFAMAKFEVSIEDYMPFCKQNESCGALNKKDNALPLTNISVADIQRYLIWLSQTTKQVYRLPTKAEWIYAARASSGEMDSNRNCELNSYGIQKGKVLVKASTGQANKWGLVSMVGNAQELIKQGGNRYVALGGSYQTAMAECTIDTVTTHSGQPDPRTGFRFVREIAKQ